MCAILVLKWQDVLSITTFSENWQIKTVLFYQAAWYNSLLLTIERPQQFRHLDWYISYTYSSRVCRARLFFIFKTRWCRLNKTKPVPIPTANFLYSNKTGRDQKFVLCVRHSDDDAHIRIILLCLKMFSEFKINKTLFLNWESDFSEYLHTTYLIRRHTHTYFIFEHQETKQTNVNLFITKINEKKC